MQAPDLCVCAMASLSILKFIAVYNWTIELGDSWSDYSVPSPNTMTSVF